MFSINSYLLPGVKCCGEGSCGREDTTVTKRGVDRRNRQRQVHTQIRRCKLRDLTPRRTLRCLLCVAGTHQSAGNVTRTLLRHFNDFTNILRTDRRRLYHIPNINPTDTQVLRLLPRIDQCCRRDHADARNTLAAARQLTTCLGPHFTKTGRRGTLLLSLSDHDQMGDMC